MPHVGGAVVMGYALFHFRETLLNFYFFDDYWVMYEAAQVRIRSVADLLKFFEPSHMGFAMYRPLTTVFYSWALQSFVGYDSSAQHGVQLLVFATNALLAFAITLRLTGSTAAATATGLLYGAAPGQAIPVFWLSAFTVTGTVFLLLVMMTCWVHVAARWRGAVCVLVQILALGSSEHAVAGPVLLGVLAAMWREPMRPATRAILPSAMLVAAYLAAKLYYFIVVIRPPQAAFILGTYGLTPDVRIWALHLGQYFVQCFTPLVLWRLGETACSVIGWSLVAIFFVALWRAYRAGGSWILIAGGIAVFVASLGAAFAQRRFASPYMCLAVLGAAWLVVGLFGFLGRPGRWLALAFAVAMLIVDRRTQERAWRDAEVFRLTVNGSLASVRWVETARRAAQANQNDVLIPKDSVTSAVFGMGRLETFFPEMPTRITLYDNTKPLAREPDQTNLAAVVELTTPEHFPGAQPHWSWLRWLAGQRGDRVLLGSSHQFLGSDIAR